MRAVIVEDWPDVRHLLRQFLSEKPGMDIVGETGDAQEAVELIEASRPDLVLLDIGLPGGSGIEVLHRIKSLTPPPVVIMLTALGQEEYRSACMAAGADFFFEKTTELPDLRRTLTALSRHIPNQHGAERSL